MRIRNVRHKGLRHFMEAADPSGLPARHIEKIRHILAFLQDMADPEELYQVAMNVIHRNLVQPARRLSVRRRG